MRHTCTECITCNPQHVSSATRCSVVGAGWTVCRRAGTLASSKAATSIARGMVADMRNRLHDELSEREAEAALYSAKLYESERQMSDWWVSHLQSHSIAEQS